MIYHTIRRLHLYSSFVLAAFIMMYFVTGFVMIFEDRFQRKDVEEREIRTPIPSRAVVSSTDALAGWLQQELGLGGQWYEERRKNDVTLHFRHPGTVTTVRVLPNIDTAFITIKKGNVYSVMHGFHRLHGYKGGVNYYLWSFFYDLSALSMIVFAATGLYLWWKTTSKRLAGMLVFLSFTAVTAVTIIYLMFYS